MEDCKVYYDGSVRNASGSIIQFLYGDDGMDASKIENQQIPYVDISYTEFVKRYKFDKNELKTFTNEEKQQINEHVAQLEKDREFVLLDLFRAQLENSVMCSVSLYRIINIAKGTFMNIKEKDKVFDLTPKYILDKIQELSTRLFVNKNHKGNLLFQILLRAYLSPKIIINQHKLNKCGFDYIIKEIEQRYFESLAHPSEMVGVVSAQSIGEPSVSRVEKRHVLNPVSCF